LESSTSSTFLIVISRASYRVLARTMPSRTLRTTFSVTAELLYSA
jgi:hypothetical protein